MEPSSHNWMPMADSLSSSTLPDCCKMKQKTSLLSYWRCVLLSGLLDTFENNSEDIVSSSSPITNLWQPVLKLKANLSRTEAALPGVRLHQSVQEERHHHACRLPISGLELQIHSIELTPSSMAEYQNQDPEIQALIEF